MSIFTAIPAPLRKAARAVLPASWVDGTKDYILRHYYTPGFVNRTGPVKGAIQRHVLHKPPQLHRLLYHVTDHCNLNCKGCTHFSNIAEKHLADPEQYRAEITRLTERVLGHQRDLPARRRAAAAPRARRVHPHHPCGVPGVADQRDDQRRARLADARRRSGMRCARPTRGCCATTTRSVRRRRHHRGRARRTASCSSGPTRARSSSSCRSTCQVRRTSAVSFRRCRGVMNCPVLRDGRIYPCAYTAFVDIFIKKFGTRRPRGRGVRLDRDRRGPVRDLGLPQQPGSVVPSLRLGTARRRITGRARKAPSTSGSPSRANLRSPRPQGNPECLRLTTALRVPRRRSILTNTAMNGVAQAATILSTLVFFPLLYAAFGAGDFGVYIIASTVTGMAVMFDFGIGTSTVRHVAERLALDDLDGFSVVVSSTAALLDRVGRLCGCRRGGYRAGCRGALQRDRRAGRAAHPAASHRCGHAAVVVARRHRDPRAGRTRALRPRGPHVGAHDAGQRGGYRPRPAHRRRAGSVDARKCGGDGRRNLAELHGALESDPVARIRCAPAGDGPTDRSRGAPDLRGRLHAVHEQRAGRPAGGGHHPRAGERRALRDRGEAEHADHPGHGAAGLGGPAARIRPGRQARRPLRCASCSSKAAATSPSSSPRSP